MIFSLMQRRQARYRGDSGPGTANLWMVSYADMATLLLAMFIAISSMGQDQTGLGYERGTKGLRERLAGRPHPSRVTALPESSAGYGGQGAKDEPGRSIDAEEERFQRFLVQLKSRFGLTRRTPLAARASVDVYEDLAKGANSLPPAVSEAVAPLLALARQHDCRLEVVVWAASPGEEACVRATRRAAQLGRELADLGGYDGLWRTRMVAVGQVWRYPDVRRPVFSLVLNKRQPAPAVTPEGAGAKGASAGDPGKGGVKLEKARAAEGR